MVSSKRTGGTVDGFIEGHQGGKTEHLGPLPLSMVSSKGALGQGALSMVSSKDTMEGGNREYHTHSGIYVAFHLRFAAEKEWQVFISFPIRFFLNWSIKMKGCLAITQSSNAAGKTIKSKECQQNPKAARQGLEVNRQIHQ